MKKKVLTMIIEKGESVYYIGRIQEYPAAMSQGLTIEELKDNLLDALNLLLEVQIDQLNE